MKASELNCLERILQVLLDEAHFLEGVPGRVGLCVFLVVDRNGRLENVPVDHSLEKMNQK